MLDKKMREKWKRAVLLLGCMVLVFSGCGKTGDVKESGAVESQTAAEQAEEVTETTEVSETIFQIPENYSVVITVKINPELRIYLDENANVLAVEPVNEDAQKLIAAMQLEGMTFETCMEKMIAHAHEMGYLKEDGTIQVTAEGDEEEFCSKILEKAKISISSVIEKENIKVAFPMGLCMISEGVIPIAMNDIIRTVICTATGCGVTGAISFSLDVGSKVPSGGVFVIPAMSNPIAALIALLAGTAVTGVLLVLIKKKKTEEDEPMVDEKEEDLDLSGFTIS